MFIDEIATGTEVQLHITIGTQTLDLNTTVREGNSRTHSIVTDVIVRDGKVVNISGKNVLVDVIFIPSEGLPRIFRNAKVAVFKDKDKYSYRITSLIQAVGLNRRESYRVYIGKDITLQCGSNKKTIDAVLKDISSSGVAFTLNSGDDSGFEMGQIVHTVLNDNLEEINENNSFQIYAIIVRKEELDNGKVIYGCLLNSRMPGLDKYIMTKERLRLQSTRGRK